MVSFLPADTTVIDLRGLEPAPERLVEIVRRSALRPDCEIAVDWGGRFPWTIDATLIRVDAFPEAVVAAVASACTEASCRLSVVVRSVPPAVYSSRSAYRHLERARRRSGHEWRRALAKLTSDLVDDLRSLAPDLFGVVVSPECEHAELVERACVEAGLAVRSLTGKTPRGRHSGVEAVPGGVVGDEESGEAERTGGIEERLSRAGHPARLDRPFAAVHEELRRSRRSGWELVARAHERLIAAEADGPRRDRELVDAVRDLGRHLRGLRAVRSRFDETYAGLVPDGAVARLIRGVELPLREQYGQLSARTRAIRALR